MREFTLKEVLRNIIASIFLLIGFNVFNIYGQVLNNFPPNNFQSPDNQLYWKNRPHGNYWQQDVHYNIDAKLVAESDLIEGFESLDYFNNSPDTITVVYFHLYQNAFVSGSYYHQLEKVNKSRPFLSRYELDGLGTAVKSVKHDGVTVGFSVDNTIMMVALRKPLFPGKKTNFQIEFTTYFGRGNQRRRMKTFNIPQKDPQTGLITEVKHFDVVHWYPRICVYDRKFRWETDQHLTREFYGDFGTFDVNFLAPNDYILDATGVHLNEKEIYTDGLKEKVDLKRFASKPLGEPATQIIKPDGTYKTWRFHAENVHDFALTADPTYRIGEITWNGIKIVALAQEEHASGWQDAASFTAKVIETYSRDIGMYAYPKMIVADARDGMEYPMLTLDGGITPDYKGLLAHEVGHNWFFGMVGSNETYRAFLDEGFTQFLTAWALESIEKDKSARYNEIYGGYISAAKDDLDGDISTHSDHFNSAKGHGGGYGQVYFKTAAMLYNLQYVLGDKLFIKSMQHYFDKWKFKHPYPEDFREAIIEYTKTDLNYFFDQWLNSDRKIDYGIQCVKKIKNRGGNNILEIKLKRKGDFQVPIDFSVIHSKGDTAHYLIPVNYFHKNEPNRTVLPYWFGWDKLNRTYTARVPLKNGYEKIIIDPTLRLPDINLLDNSTGSIFSKADYSFMRPSWKMVNWERYSINFYPYIWWNANSGMQFGLGTNGQYYRDQRRYNALLFYNSGIGTFEQNTDQNITSISSSKDYHKFGYSLMYGSTLPMLGNFANFEIGTLLRDGLRKHYLSISKKFVKGSRYAVNYTRLYMNAGYLLRSERNDLLFLNQPQHWSSQKVNSHVNLGIERNYQLFSGVGNFTIELRTPGIDGDFNYSWLKGESKHVFTYWDKIDLRIRIFGQYITGNAPLESKLYLAGGNPESQFEDAFLRGRGFIPTNWLPQNLNSDSKFAFQYGGGLNLRGYNGLGYGTNFVINSNLSYGDLGASFNGELSFGKILVGGKTSNTKKIVTPDIYLFYDGGIIGYNQPKLGIDKPIFDKFRSDAGIGLTLTINSFEWTGNRNPVVLRFDVPFWLSHPTDGSEMFKGRYVLGFGKTF